MHYQVLEVQKSLRTRLLWILIPTAIGCVAALLFRRFVLISEPNPNQLVELSCLAIFPIIGFLIGYSRGGVPDYLIDPEGIKSASIWGNTKSIRWSEIDRIRFIRKQRILTVAGGKYFNTPNTLSIHMGSFGDALFDESLGILKEYLHPHFDLSEVRIPASGEELREGFVVISQELKKWAKMRTIWGHIFALTSAFVVGTLAFGTVMAILVLIQMSDLSHDAKNILMQTVAYVVALSLPLSFILYQKIRLAKMDERKRYEELGWQWRKTQDTRRINPI